MSKLISIVTTFAVVLCLASCGGDSKGNTAQEANNEIPSLTNTELVEHLRKEAQNVNGMCPMEQGNGVVMESVTYESGVWQYNYLVQGETFYVEDNDLNSKEAIKASYRGKPIEQKFIRALIQSNSKMVFHYHTQGGKTLDITLTTPELEDILE